MEQNRVKIKASSQCVAPYFLEAWGIDADAKLETEVVSPKTLLTAGRLDLACKLYYIDCMEQKADMAFARELYQAHLESFSNGTFVEPGQKAKNSVQDYFEAFHQMIEDMREHGFDPDKSVVPVGDDGTILDGSHRVAIAIYYDIPLTIVHIPEQSCRYDYSYFRKKGLQEKYLDFMALQFIRFSEKVYTVCLWPAAYESSKLAEADRLIRACASVVYQKTVPLNDHAVELLMIHFYKSMTWTGSLSNGFSGVASKAQDCYRSKVPTTVYVICGPELEQVIELKQRIRDLFGIENSSVHITDTHEEAVQAGRLLLHQNSVDFMNAGNPFRRAAFVKDFAPKAEELQRYATCDTSLALFGIGEHTLCVGSGENTAWQDPEDYFWFWGIKLPSLNFVKAAKKRDAAFKEVRKIEAFERRRRSLRAAVQEWTGQIMQRLIKFVSRITHDVHAEVTRTIKVFWHGIKYRNLAAGTGKKNTEDLQSAFLNFNTTTADYLVLRNWEGFFDDILLEGHNDIDLLCRDRDSRDIIIRFLDARPLTSDGFHYSFQYKGRQVTLDTRILGDGYYDRRWQRRMLQKKKQHPLGFYIMDPENYYFSLIYHAVYQKKDDLSAEYARRLNQMSPSNETLTQSDFAEQLNDFMQRNRYAYTVTQDKGVVHDFEKTPVRKRLCYPLSIRLRHFAQNQRDKHLLQKLKIMIHKMLIRR